MGNLKVKHSSSKEHLLVVLKVIVLCGNSTNLSRCELAAKIKMIQE